MEMNMRLRKMWLEALLKQQGAGKDDVAAVLR
jgi:hypothetical protein